MWLRKLPNLTTDIMWLNMFHYSSVCFKQILQEILSVYVRTFGIKICDFVYYFLRICWSLILPWVTYSFWFVSFLWTRETFRSREWGSCWTRVRRSGNFVNLRSNAPFLLSAASSLRSISAAFLFPSPRRTNIFSLLNVPDHVWRWRRKSNRPSPLLSDFLQSM